MPTTAVQQDPNVTNQQPAQPDASATPASWDEFMAKQPEEVKALYATHTTGLQNTVKATRQERDDLAKQTKELLTKVEKGSEAEKALTDTLAKLEASERRAAFLEEATRPEIGCRNPKAAYALAQAEQLFDRRGAPAWADIKAAAPELFGAPAAPPANAGTGTGTPPASGKNMNDFILAAAGRRR